MGRKTDERTCEYSNGRDRQIGRLTDVSMEWCVASPTNGWVNVRMGLMDGWMDGR